MLRTPLTHDDIEGVYAGLRPLLEGESDNNSALSREHAVTQHVPGLISVAGGKYTTYRVMARDAVDMAARNLDRRVPPSCTERVPLIGAVGYEAMWNRRHTLAEASKLHVARIEHLLGRYGSQTALLLELIGERPDLGEPIAHGGPYLAAEVVFAVTHEGALHLDDVLTRRTRLSIETFHRGVDCAAEVAALMAGPLGWDDHTQREELNHYRLRVAAERDSQTRPDDRTADSGADGRPRAPSPHPAGHPAVAEGVKSRVDHAHNHRPACIVGLTNRCLSRRWREFSLLGTREGNRRRPSVGAG